MIVPCECGAKLKIDIAKIGPSGVRIRCPRCGNILSVRRPSEEAVAPKPGTRRPRLSAGPVVLIAHDSEMVRETISSVLKEDGFGVDMAADGVEALKKARENKPEALVLDVGLPGIYGFELCERLKGSEDTAHIKIILLSSVYDMRRYKRTPVNLYGADDYIEKHHIPDFLTVKLRKLLFPEQFSDNGSSSASPRNELPETARPPAREFEPSLLARRGPAEESAGSQATAGSKVKQGSALPQNQDAGPVMPDSFSLDASIFQKEECDIPRVEAADPEAVEKARRFARIIVSDIALYNQSAVIEGLQNGTFYDLLKADIDEGREIFEKRVPAVIRSQKDYYQEAFDNFINAQQKNVR